MLMGLFFYQYKSIDFYITGDIDKFRYTMEKIVDLSEFDVKFHKVKIEDLEKYKK